MCERWCVTTMCVKDGGVTKLCERQMQRRSEEAREEERERDTESKTQTPHNDVGKNHSLMEHF